VHGIIFLELRKYAEARLGASAWESLLREAKLSQRIYMPVAEYSDQEAVALIGAATVLTGWKPQDVLEDFGSFLVPGLLALYGTLLNRRWRTLDVIEHAEETIHQVVCVRNPGARPPGLRCMRASPEEVILCYRSARRMCSLARGIAHGLAHHFAEVVAIREPRCMLRGGEECLMSIRRMA
jgi:hypothetical protein